MIAWLRGQWRAMQPRERRTLIAGVAVLSIAGYYLLLQPLVHNNKRLLTSQAHLHGSNQWLLEQRPLLERLHNSCPRSAVQGEGKLPKKVVSDLARRHGLSVSERHQGAGQPMVLQVDGKDGNRLMHFIYQLACNGYQLQTLNLRSDPSKVPGVSAKLEIIYD